MHNRKQLDFFRQQLNSVTLIDKAKLVLELDRMINTKIITEQDVIAFEERLQAALLRYEQKQKNSPVIRYPENLPVTAIKDEILATIRDNQVTIIAGETGSGKTTQIPKICLELGLGRKGFIGHTQPRRLAARSVATRIAEELEIQLGSTVGYKVRFNDQIQENTLIKLMTDGILLAEIQQDRLLMQYDTIIIDEAHERSLNIDFILGYLKQILPQRPDLKVIITSATIDPERFSQHFNQAPIVEASGRTYPVEVRYRPISENQQDNDDIEDSLLQGIVNAVDELSHESAGDILVFLSGEREIRDVADILNKLALRHTEVLPLYARLSNAEQNRIFQSHSGRRIILSTNVAETSLTVPGIKYVIDSGLARISRYSYRTKVQRLPVEPISQASANQRKGRCGRVSDGICIRLYDEQDYLSRPEFTDPEILRTNLASVILQMTSLGLGNITAFPFLQAPDQRNIKDGIRLLEELGAISLKQKRYQLTSNGKILSRFPVDPRLGRMLIEARNQGCIKELLIITSALSIQDPRERPLEKQQASDEKHRRFADKQSDFVTLVNLWNYIKEQQKLLTGNQFRRLCQKEYLNYLRIREWQDVYTQVRQVIKEIQFPINSIPADYRAIHCSLLTGLLSHVGLKDVEKHEYTGARNIKFSIFPNSVIFKKPPKWCVVAELVETSRLWGRVAAMIEPEWIEPLAQHIVKRSYSEPHWSKNQGAVIGKEKVTLFGLPIVVQRDINYGLIDSVVSRELFIRHALVEGDWITRHPFFYHNRQLIEDVEVLENKARRRDILVDVQVLFEFYNKRLPKDIVSTKYFDKWWKDAEKTSPDLLNFEKHMLINDDASKVSLLDYPDVWYQHNLALPLTYQFEPGMDADGVTVHIPIDLLNQVTEEGFDWQVPGLRKELIIALIKSLAKPLRRHFVPAPNYADAFLSRVIPFSGSILSLLEKEFLKISGIKIDRKDWNLDQIPDHLKITFRVIEHRGNLNTTLLEGKDLSEIKKKLKDHLHDVLAIMTHHNTIERSGLTHWEVDTIPTVYEHKRQQYTVKAYPALVDKKETVDIILVETEEEQQRLSLLGIRRLLLLNIPSPIKYLHEKLPNKAKLGLYFNTFGSVLDLIDDCIACGVDSLIEEKGGLVWNKDSYNVLLQHVKENLNDIVVDIAQQVEKILTLTFEINKKLKGKIDMQMAFALSDIKVQLNQLVYKNFVSNTKYKKLPDLYRYLRSIERRIEKLKEDPNRDRVNITKIEQVLSRYKQFVEKLPINKRELKEVIELRWMIEELRVNLFAQQIGTPYPISEKRIIQQLESIENNFKQ